EREGIEASAVLMVGERLTFNANGTYVRGEETKAENPPIPGLPPPTTSEIDSRHTYALGMNYVHPVAGSTVEFSADYSFRSKIDQQVIHYLGYGTLNWRVNWVNVRGTGLDLGFFMRNALDEDGRLVFGNGSLAFGYLSHHFEEPRTYGLELSYQFGGG